MSDTKKPEKAKRGYRVGGAALAYDLCVRLDADTVKRLEAAAKSRGTTRAQVAREILQSALNPDEK